ncbi:DUF1707 domain-containing protein [Gordonia sp. ABSL11-1]|uniref:DUF1707 SHOCT-like domain-containing protein n=1 Tax=Gordonia sp. ABSL11-1 TaxID=3053924 RepID=UPI00257287DA|nr:DUF1707 domain-containing protein [Gordonia sp. ABSL11-1]MDL9947638.1 DUF1707 domain-containing protein [Gordonia sp. ABSL11-1]
MADSVEDQDVRVGHPERERATSLLSDAFSSGYLEIIEFEERSEAVIAARTRGDLRALLADLPNAAMLFPDARPTATSSTAVTPAGRTEWDIDWTTLRRKGGWQVPPEMLVSGSWGTLDVDFSKAVFTTATVDLALQVSTCTVKLRLGADQEIRSADLTTTGWSSLKDKAGPPARPGGAVIVLSGALSAMTGLVIKRV